MILLEKVYPNKAIASHVYRWYKRIGVHIPKIIAHEGSIIKYEYIKGWTCKDPEKIHVLAKKIIWTNPRKEKLELRKFRSQVLATCMDFDISRSLLELDKDDLTVVDNVHGHLISDHVIENSRGLTFISPGYSYGLKCRELDEAWLIHSFHGDVSFPIRECHVILLSALQGSQSLQVKMSQIRSSFWLSHIAVPTTSI